MLRNPPKPPPRHQKLLLNVRSRRKPAGVNLKQAARALKLSVTALRAARQRQKPVVKEIAGRQNLSVSLAMNAVRVRVMRSTPAKTGRQGEVI
jgi:hypothetical protein